MISNIVLGRKAVLVEKAYIILNAQIFAYSSAVTEASDYGPLDLTVFIIPN